MYPVHDQNPIATEHMLRERLAAYTAFVDRQPRHRPLVWPWLLVFSVILLTVILAGGPGQSSRPLSTCDTVQAAATAKCDIPAAF